MANNGDAPPARADDSPDCLYVLLPGKVVLDAGAESDAAVIEIAQPMSPIGLPPVVLGHPSPMTARALEPSEFLCIVATALRDLVETNARLSLIMLLHSAREYQTVAH